MNFHWIDSKLLWGENHVFPQQIQNATLELHMRATISRDTESDYDEIESRNRRYKTSLIHEI